MVGFDWGLFGLFAVLNIANVILQTIKSLCTVKGGKLVASSVSAFAYGFYTIVLVYMNCDLTLWAKVLVVGGANFIGVWFVKWLEEKSRKDKIWKIEMSVKTYMVKEMIFQLEEFGLSYNYFNSQGHTVFNVYANNKTENINAKEVACNCEAKYFVIESTSL